MVSQLETCRAALTDEDDDARWVDALLEDARAGRAQCFPMCERGVLPAVRFGGLCVLENVNLADAGVLEGLNSLLDLEPAMTLRGQRIRVHPSLRVLGLVHSPALRPLSPAVSAD